MVKLALEFPLEPVKPFGKGNSVSIHFSFSPVPNDQGQRILLMHSYAEDPALKFLLLFAYRDLNSLATEPDKIVHLFPNLRTGH